MRRKPFLYAAAAAALLLCAMQLYRPAAENPPADPAASFESVAKPSKEVAALVARSCRDCHSNETAWPWYSRVAPASWLVVADVREGRARLNLSEWNRLSPEMSGLRVGEMCEEARAGKMPLWQYTLVHPGAKLGAADVTALCSAAR